MTRSEPGTADLRTFLRVASFVGGRWIAAADGGTIAVHNPATNTLPGHVPDCGSAEVGQAVAAASARAAASMTTST